MLSPTLYSVTPGTTTKTTLLSQAVTALIAVSTAFIVASLLNLSLFWVELGSRITKMRVERSNNLQHWWRVVLSLQLLAVVSMLVTLFRATQFAGFVGAILFVVVVITCRVAISRMRQAFGLVEG